MDKLIDFLKKNRAGLVLTAIMFIVSFLGACLTALFGGGETATAFSSAIWGTLALVSLNAVARYVGYILPTSTDMGVLGIALATAVTLIVF